MAEIQHGEKTEPPLGPQGNWVCPGSSVFPLGFVRIQNWPSSPGKMLVPVSPLQEVIRKVFIRWIEVSKQRTFKLSKELFSSTCPSCTNATGPGLSEEADNSENLYCLIDSMYRTKNCQTGASH